MTQIASGDIPLSSDFPEKYRNYTGNDYTAYIDLIEGVVREFIEHNRANVEPEVYEKNVRDVVEFEKKLYMVLFYYYNFYNKLDVCC